MFKKLAVLEPQESRAAKATVIIDHAGAGKLTIAVASKHLLFVMPLKHFISDLHILSL